MGVAEGDAVSQGVPLRWKLDRWEGPQPATLRGGGGGGGGGVGVGGGGGGDGGGGGGGEGGDKGGDKAQRSESGSKGQRAEPVGPPPSTPSPSPSPSRARPRRKVAAVFVSSDLEVGLGGDTGRGDGAPYNPAVDAPELFAQYQELHARRTQLQAKVRGLEEEKRRLVLDAST